ncbi:MAG: antibiotic biosynthesis monooxygenase [Chitinophagales bacterium]|nr:antibiotic biosynthesis monooxygenase [Chitinophagales bacterium]MCZ2393312.1 antibiotic biosynthesis monooxygenase [Chitinophagales bacterium]
MIIRIVKLHFKAEELEDFKSYFESIAPQIRKFEGCHHLELLQQVDMPEMIYTYSYWEDEDALERYRYSELFKTFWAVAKSKFAGKPEAWSLNKIAVVEG